MRVSGRYLFGPELLCMLFNCAPFTLLFPCLFFLCSFKKNLLFPQHFLQNCQGHSQVSLNAAQEEAVVVKKRTKRRQSILWILVFNGQLWLVLLLRSWVLGSSGTMEQSIS